MTVSMPEETILIVTDDVPKIALPNGARGGDDLGPDWLEEMGTDTSGSKKVNAGVEVSVQKLEKEMTRFLQMVGRLFSHAEEQVNDSSGMRLNEIELAVEISGEGQVMLIGNGGKAGGKGAIKLKFQRRESN